MFDFQINYWAVLVSGLAAFVLGGLWYSPVLFAKQWTRAHGYSEEQVHELQKSAPQAYAVSFVCYVLVALAMAMLVDRLDIVSALSGVKVGLLCWGGFAATLGLIANVYSNKPIAAFLIDALYQMLYLVAMGAIIGGWR
jgi:hypothetical protein